MKAYLYLTAFLIATTQIMAGQAGKGGYFAFTKTEKKLKRVGALLSAGITGITPEELNSISSEYTNQYIDPYDLARIVRDVKALPLEDRTRLNDYGVEAPLELDYSSEKREIYALKNFFLLNTKPGELKDSDFEFIGAKLVHEASHIFKIGINDDNDSAEFSEKIIKKIFRSTIIILCGRSGSIEQKLEYCNTPVFKNYRKSENLTQHAIEGFDLITIGNSELGGFFYTGEYSILRSKEYPEITVARFHYLKAPSDGITYLGEENTIPKFCKRPGTGYRMPNYQEAKEFLEKFGFKKRIFFVTIEKKQKPVYKTLSPEGVITSLGYWTNNEITGDVFCIK